MFRALCNLLGIRTSAPASGPATMGDEKLRELIESDLTVIAALQSDGLDPKGMTKEQLLAEIEAAAKDSQERMKEGFDPFVYESDGKRRLPFFTSDSQCHTFLGEYSKQHNRVYPFQLLGVKGSLLPRMAAACDVLVMNDRCPEELELSAADVAAIKRLCP
jgi:hypothetical protein